MNATDVPAKRTYPWDSMFDCSLSVMESADIPAGWRPIYDQMLARLRAMKSPARDRLYISRPAVSPAGGLDFEAMYDDPAVVGVLRKTSNRLMHTCMECARPALLRQVSLLRRVSLCAGCYVPLALEREVRMLENWLEGKATSEAEASDGIDEESIPPLVSEVLPKASWRTLGIRVGSESKRFLLRTDLANLLPSIREMICRIRKDSRRSWISEAPANH